MSKDKNKELVLKWGKKGKKNKSETCYLHENVLLDLPELATPYLIFRKTVNIDELVDILVDQSNIYATQNGQEFETNREEMLAFLGINYVMSICKLPTLKCYWMADDYITNDGIRNVITRDRFMEILKNILSITIMMQIPLTEGIKYGPSLIT